MHFHSAFCQCSSFISCDHDSSIIRHTTDCRASSFMNTIAISMGLSTPLQHQMLSDLLKPSVRCVILPLFIILSILSRYFEGLCTWPADPEDPHIPHAPAYSVMYSVIGGCSILHLLDKVRIHPPSSPFPSNKCSAGKDEFVITQPSDIGPIFRCPIAPCFFFFCEETERYSTRSGEIRILYHLSFGIWLPYTTYLYSCLHLVSLPFFSLWILD